MPCGRRSSIADLSQRPSTPDFQASAQARMRPYTRVR
jgi:hypothetical protein